VVYVLFRLSPTDIKRAFKRLGIKVNVSEVKAEELIIRTVDGKELVMASPQTVLLIKMPGETVMVQAVGSIEERSSEEKVEISEEDVRLVAEQAGVSIEEARQALLEAGGDIAAAIMLLEERRKASLGK